MKRKIDESQEMQSTENKYRKIFHSVRQKRKMEECEDENKTIKRRCNTDLLHSSYIKYFEQVYKTYCDPDQESFFNQELEETKAYYIY
jgi:hypothetical protein